MSEQVIPGLSGGNGVSIPAPSLIDIAELLASAQRTLAQIQELAESAKKAGDECSENQKKSSVALGEMQSKITEVNAVAALAIAAKTQIVSDQAVISTKSDHIQNAQEHADKVRGDLDRTLTAATQQLTETEGSKSRTKALLDSTEELVAAIRKNKSASEADATAISTAKETANQSATTTKNLADKAAMIEERIASYENRLAELDSQCKSQLETIVGLLPGATSAGLAHAFDQRRQTFIMPRKRWQWIFVGSVLFLVALAGSGLWHVYSSGSAASYDELIRLWLVRLPIAGALIWLALHAGQESALAKRLEEDYGYKSAVASSFQGFHKQMSEIGTSATLGGPLAKLCTDTLTTLAEPPGRIYDKHRLTVSPTSELTDVAQKITETVVPGK